MHQVVRHEIPCVMFGPRGIERTHGVDEWADVGDLVTVSRLIARLLVAVSASSGRDVHSAGTATTG
jgi:acetylornithine deacetylase/succinyl-diaminopimelate desuccinylase-like protein